MLVNNSLITQERTHDNAGIETQVYLCYLYDISVYLWLQYKYDLLINIGIDT